MKITSCLALSMLPLLVVGCASSSPKPMQAPAAAAPATVEPFASTPPSLASEAAAQNRRDSEKASLRVGVKVEEQAKATAPAWFAPAVMTQGRGGGSALAPKLSEAVDVAVSKAGAQVEARGGNPRSLKVERVAYARLSTGEYVAWAAIGDGSNMGEVAVAPVVEPSAPAAPKAPEPTLPSLNDPKAAIATGVKNDAGVAQVKPAEPAAAASDSNTPPAKVAEVRKPEPEKTVAKRVEVAKPETTSTEVKKGEIAKVDGKADVKKPETAKIEVVKPAPAKAEVVRIEAPKAEASLPTLSQPRAAVVTAPKSDGSVPGWWDPAPSQRGKRVAMGVRVDGATPRDCARGILAKGRALLEGAVGEAPRELLTDRTWLESLPDGTHRMFSIVSCEGTLKTKESPKP